jgi:tellurite resistance protein
MERPMSETMSRHDALVYIMVMMSAVDRAMTDKELERIGRLTRSLPVFEGFDEDRLPHVTAECTALLGGPEGLDIALEVVREALPARLFDTAYALAVELAAADLFVRQEEIRLLQLLRDRLGLDKLTCAAIERGAMARLRK